jgi:hypothetical protein
VQLSAPTRRPGPAPTGRPGTAADLLAGGGALALVAVAAAVGWWLNHSGRPVQAAAAPLFAIWGPHVGTGSVPAVLVAVLVVAYGPSLAARLRWPALLLAGYAAAVGWILALALVDGWTTGLATRLALDAEYLTEVPGVTDIPATLTGFTGRILDFRPDSWTTHVAGHPPGALLVFAGLDRVGLGGGVWAAMVCVLVGALTVVAVPVTLRALGDESAARAALPFLALLPGAVWLGVSADAFFAGVTATGVALLALAAARGGLPGAVLAVGAGLLLGCGLFLSYGLVLLAPVALVVLAVTRRWWALAPAALGVAAVVVAFAAAGFWWYDGYRLVTERYYQGIAAQRPYAYWVWANLAALVLAAGPVVGPVLRRTVATALTAVRSSSAARRDGAGRNPRLAGRFGRSGWRSALTGPVGLPLAAVLAIGLADASGLSKAEVERIWLPFTVWLTAGTALLPTGSRRWWLAAQAVTALAVNHLVWTVW